MELEKPILTKRLVQLDFQAINERLGNHGYTRNSYSITGAYNLKIANDQHLAAGIKLGYFNSGTDLNALSTEINFKMDITKQLTRLAKI